MNAPVDAKSLLSGEGSRFDTHEVRNQARPPSRFNAFSDDIVLNPSLIAEVLSPTTQHFDRADKLNAYRRLPGLQHILLLSGMEQAAWACSRVPADSAWTDLTPWQRDTPLVLGGLALQLPWAEVYGGVGL